MTDLDKLIAAVEAGNIGSAREAVAAIEAALGGLDGYRDGVAMDVVAAFIGSLGAAKRLHDALLPGCGWTLVDDGRARIWQAGDAQSHPSILVDWQASSDPARAWLLAILRAVKAKDATP